MNKLSLSRSGLALCSLILLCVPSWGHADTKKHDIEKALKQLDEAVAHYPEYEQQRIEEINRKKQELSQATFDSDRYLVMMQIQNQYKKLNSDSAMVYVNRSMALAQQCHRADWYKETLLARGSIYTYRGNLMLARQDYMALGGLDSLPRQMQARAASALCSFYRIYTRVAAFKNSALHAQTLAAMHIDWQTLPDRYLRRSPADYYRARAYVGLDNQHFFTQIKAIYDANSKRGDNVNTLGYILATLYKERGDSMAYRYYLIKTVERHVRNVYKCSDATLSLLQCDWLLDHPERAYRYVKLYSSDISKFQDGNRSVSVIAIQNKIVQRFIEEQDDMRTSLIIALILAIALCSLSVVLTVKLRHRVKKIKELNGRIDRRNQSLAENLKEIEHMSAELKAYNAKLQDEIKLRDGNFMDTYLMCSDYVKMHQNFKKTIANLLKTGSVKQAIKQASSKDLMDTELKEFYRKFDRAFMSTHPDFIDRFNLLLRHESRYTSNEDGSLTPELRIYALISLGISNSVNIAEFLHYSAQTIYNYRLRTRRQACIPEAVFAEAVGSLYDDARLKRYLTMGDSKD